MFDLIIHIIIITALTSKTFIFYMVLNYIANKTSANQNDTKKVDS
jgi:hypothetical protein